MSDIEQRLRSALEARAALVQPEDLSLNPVLEPPEPEPGSWWQRPGAYLFVAAVAVIVIALPLLALAATRPDGKSEQPPPVEQPTTEMTDSTPMQVDSRTGDVDGDGAPDDIRVMSVETDGSVLDYSIEVDLSSTGATVSYDHGAAADLALGQVANVDGRSGADIIAVADAETDELYRAVPIVVSLRDGELAQVLDADLGAGDDPDLAGTLTYWWVKDGELWWWRSKRPQELDEKSSYAVDVTRFAHGDLLRARSEGTSCVTGAEPERLTACGSTEPPTGQVEDPDATDDPSVDPPAVDQWWDQHPDGLPASWGVETSGAGGFSGDLDGDGTSDFVEIAAPDTGLEVRVTLAGGDRLTAPIEGANPLLEGLVRLDGLGTPVVVGHTTEGAAGTTYVTWFAYAVVGGELVELGTAPLGPSFASIYSNLPPSDGGHPTVRTWLAGDGALHGMDYLARKYVEGPDGTDIWAYQVRVRTWFVEGTTLRATVPVIGCVAPEIGQEFYACPDGL